jgi:N-acylglucosamine 2-epimerase/mannose-6-phosphate isomerase
MSALEKDWSRAAFMTADRIARNARRRSGLDLTAAGKAYGARLGGSHASTSLSSVSADPFRFDEVRRWIFEQALPLWAGAGLDHGCGGSVECLAFDGSDAARPVKRLRVQARQVYAFSHAAILGAGAQTDAAAEHCWSFLIGKGRREDKAFVRLLNRDGSVRDATADAYDMAFVLYACAWRIRAGDEDASEVAYETMKALDRILGFGGGRGWGAAEDAPGARMLNPHMHLLEAALELAEADRSERFRQVAEVIVGLFRRHMFEPSGRLVEAYGEGWTPVHGAGQRVEPGHLYEWTWLLHRADSVLGQDLSAEARALHGFAERHGLDAATGLAFDGLDGEALEPRRTYRIWCQTEALKAHLALFEHQGMDTRARIAATLDILLDRYLAVPLSGGWQDRFAEGWAPIAPDIPASILYHLMLAFSELLRLEPSLRAPLGAGADRS